ncbi:hypothetical protein NDN08_004067 [Rhodosorus marinus]|uniref:BZIP domain-containing protein n=1 Tax=Rhodosorus marinus TaxID=101924 RepID=A0AAV8UKM5_9RHOD|nr:hypothetical protein NDN08_004067 [Rhodosorus marinus]
MPRLSKRLPSLEANSDEARASNRRLKKQKMREAKKKRAPAEASAEKLAAETSKTASFEAALEQSKDLPDAERQAVQRIIRNRLSAELSRQRWKARITALETEIETLRTLRSNLTDVEQELIQMNGI